MSAAIKNALESNLKTVQANISLSEHAMSLATETIEKRAEGLKELIELRDYYQKQLLEVEK